MAVATVTGLQMATWLGVAIWYVIICSKKQSREDMEEKMEVCLKANKKGRKERRRMNEAREWSRKYEAAMRANKKDARLAMENQHFLNAHKGEAESQL